MDKKIEELITEKCALEDRIHRLELDLQEPMDHHIEEQAGQVSQHIILKRLIQVEKSNLRHVNFEIEKYRQQTYQE